VKDFRKISADWPRGKGKKKKETSQFREKVNCVPFQERARLLHTATTREKIGNENRKDKGEPRSAVSSSRK